MGLKTKVQNSLLTSKLLYAIFFSAILSIKIVTALMLHCYSSLLAVLSLA